MTPDTPPVQRAKQPVTHSRSHAENYSAASASTRTRPFALAGIEICMANPPKRLGVPTKHPSWASTNTYLKPIGGLAISWISAISPSGSTGF